MKAGEVFRPFRHFKEFAVVPEPLCKYRGLGPGAKLAWARLARFEGESGSAFPSIPTLAAELGIGSTQARSYVHELVREGFLNVEQKSGTSSRYSFLWHPAFDGEPGDHRKAPPLRKTGGVVVRKTEGVTPPENRRTPLRFTGDEESQRRESSSRESIQESQSSEAPRVSEEPTASPEPNPPEKAKPSLRGDDDENLEPPEALKKWIERKHPRPAEDPEEQTADQIVALVRHDLGQKGCDIDANFVAFIRSRATGKAKNRAGLYRRLAKEYATSREAAALERSMALRDTIKNGAKHDYDPKAKHPCCGGMGKKGDEYCSCECGGIMRQVDEYRAKKAAEGKAA